MELRAWARRLFLSSDAGLFVQRRPEEGACDVMLDGVTHRVPYAALQRVQGLPALAAAGLRKPTLQWQLLRWKLPARIVDQVGAFTECGEAAHQRLTAAMTQGYMARKCSGGEMSASDMIKEFHRRWHTYDSDRPVSCCLPQVGTGRNYIYGARTEARGAPRVPSLFPVFDTEDPYLVILDMDASCNLSLSKDTEPSRH
ncbi:unnamed protein product [Symbiodinium sp. CCMP2592]|nr:unnamed protein product [Symbiodinium sp. CCMP2592]